MPGAGINAVFHKLGDRLQWIGLRIGDDTDGVPVIGNSKLAGMNTLFFLFLVYFRHSSPQGNFEMLFRLDDLAVFSGKITVSAIDQIEAFVGC